MHTKTAILLENYSLCFNNFVYLSTKYFIQRFFNVFYSWIRRFFISISKSVHLFFSIITVFFTQYLFRQPQLYMHWKLLLSVLSVSLSVCLSLFWLSVLELPSVIV